MKLPQELLSFYSKSKPAGNNQIKHKISQFSRFGHLKLRLILRLILHLILRLNLHLLLTTFALIQFFYPIQKANAIFSDNEISRTNILLDSNNYNDIVNKFDINNIDINLNLKSAKSNYVKNTLFDRLSIRKIDFEPLQFNSSIPDYSSFDLMSLRVRSSFLSGEFCDNNKYNSDNFCYINNNCSQSVHSNNRLESFNLLCYKFFHFRYCIYDFFMRNFPLLCSDLRNFNSSDSLGNLFVAFGGAAILANTSLDSDFRNWFHRRIIRQKVNSSLNNFNVFTKKFGEMNVIAFFVLSTACYKFFPSIFPKYKTDRFTFGNYATMVTRGYIVGLPSILLGQLFVGAGRPFSETSFWFKGKYNGVSGHAFVGAIPFITAAQVTDNLFLKCIFYLCSAFTAASRIYDDAHYLSQSLLGWYIAYLSIRAVSKTEGKPIYRGLTIFPIIEKESTGAGIIFKF